MAAKSTAADIAGAARINRAIDTNPAKLQL